MFGVLLWSKSQWNVDISPFWILYSIGIYFASRIKHVSAFTAVIQEYIFSGFTFFMRSDRHYKEGTAEGVY